MHQYVIRFSAALVVVALLNAPAIAAAQATSQAGTSAPNAPRSNPQAWTLSRLPWGDPDLEGTWSSDDMRGVPVQRPQEFGTRLFLTEQELADRAKANDSEVARLRAGGTAFLAERGVRTFAQTSLIVDPPDGRLPALTSEAQQIVAANQARRRTRPASWEDRTLYDRCITRGPAGSILPVIYGNGMDITQAPGVVVLRYEMIHEARVVPLESKPHVGTNVRTYMGDPRGHWEGNTLVVETTNFIGKTAVGGNGNGAPASTQMRLVERFTRVADDRIDYELSVEDPLVYTKPFKIAFPITPQPGYQVMPYECHEGNRALSNILSSARAEERAIAEAKAKGLPEPTSLWADPARGAPGDVYSRPRQAGQVDVEGGDSER